MKKTATEMSIRNESDIFTWNIQSEIKINLFSFECIHFRNVSSQSRYLDMQTSVCISHIDFHFNGLFFFISFLLHFATHLDNCKHTYITFSKSIEIEIQYRAIE